MTSAGENEGRAVKASIHPPRLPLSVFLIIRRLVVPVLIEGPGIFPMFLHVNLKFLSRTPPLGAVILIPHAVVPLRKGAHQTTARQELDIDKPEEQPAQVGKIGDPALARLEGGDDHKKNHDGHHVLGLNHEGQGNIKISRSPYNIPKAISSP